MDNGKEVSNGKADNNGKESQLVNVRVPLDLLTSYDAIRDKSRARADCIRDLISDYVKESSGQPIVNPTSTYESLNNERTRLMSVQIKLRKIIDDVPVRSKYPPMKVLIDFASQVGHTDRNLNKDLPEAIQRIKEYHCNGDEPFNDSFVLTVVQYLECICECRLIEDKIRKCWKTKTNA